MGVLRSWSPTDPRWGLPWLFCEVSDTFVASAFVDVSVCFDAGSSACFCGFAIEELWGLVITDALWTGGSCICRVSKALVCKVCSALGVSHRLLEDSNHRCINRTALAIPSVVRQLGRRIGLVLKRFAGAAVSIATRSFIKWAIMIR